jgi:hypothetical protein
VRIAVFVVLAACGRGAPDPAAAPTGSASETAVHCEPLPFAESTPVPEASGAAWLTIDGKPMLVVIGDSGNHGAYGIVDPDTGATTEQGAVPMGDWGDDFEGLAARRGTLYALLSGGHILAYQRDGAGFRVAGDPQPIGDRIAPADLPKMTMLSDRPVAGIGMVCGGPRQNNCGRNFEGLCLDDTNGDAPCAGFVAAKSDGKLYCLVEHDGHYTADITHAIAVTKPGALADCAFDDHGRLWAGNNFFDRSEVYRIDNWRDPARAKVVEVGALGVGFPEVIAVRGDVVYRMSDTGGSPSLMSKFRCTAGAR